MVEGLHNTPYEDRLRILNLFDFNYRRIRGDLILMYKILTTPDHPLEHLFTRKVARNTRTHEHSLTVPQPCLNCRRYFFTVSVCFLWNYLPRTIVHSPSLATFKLNLDSYLCSYTLQEYHHEP